MSKSEELSNLIGDIVDKLMAEGIIRSDDDDSPAPDKCAAHQIIYDALSKWAEDQRQQEGGGECSHGVSMKEHCPKCKSETADLDIEEGRRIW